jgi:hypothetical protein
VLHRVTRFRFVGQNLWLSLVDAKIDVSELYPKMSRCISLERHAWSYMAIDCQARSLCISLIRTYLIVLPQCNIMSMVQWRRDSGSIFKSAPPEEIDELVESVMAAGEEIYPDHIDAHARLRELPRVHLKSDRKARLPPCSLFWRPACQNDLAYFTASLVMTWQRLCCRVTLSFLQVPAQPLPAVLKAVCL